jgi:regulator of cell morphogenesis and NO signaling
MGMNATTEKTVRELALESSTAPRVLEQFGLDYCCGGNRPLSDACRAANVRIDDVLDALESAALSAQKIDSNRSWTTEPLSELIAHINATHHKYTRSEIARLSPLMDKVAAKHGANHPELIEIHSTFQALAQELTTHLMKEEMVLFPYVIRMEEAVTAHEPVLPPPFGTIQNPVSMMENEHDSAGNALRAMRKASRDYTAPTDACVSFQTLYTGLAEFEADLHQHIHLENNILFPRATAMEKRG